MEMNEKLNRILKIVEEDHKLIRKMYKAQRMRTVFRIIYWALFIGISLGTYYYVQPYLVRLLDVYDSIFQDLGQVGSLFDSLPTIGNGG